MFYIFVFKNIQHSLNVPLLTFDRLDIKYVHAYLKNNCSDWPENHL